MNYFVGNTRKSRGIMELIEVEVANVIPLMERGSVSANVFVALKWTNNNHHCYFIEKWIALQWRSYC